MYIFYNNFFNNEIVTLKSRLYFVALENGSEGKKCDILIGTRGIKKKS